MRRLFTTLSALSLTLAAQGAAAQDQGFRFSGTLEGEFSSNGDADYTLLGGDLDLGYSFGSFGIEAGLQGDYILDEDVDYVAYFAAVTMATGLGDLALGAPRPVNDILSSQPQFAGSRIADLDLSAFGARVTTPILKTFGSFGYGARLMAENGALRYGVSVHQPADFHDAILLQGAAQYTTGALRLEGALEQGFVSGGEDGLNLSAGLHYDANALSGGIYLGRNDFGPSVDLLRGFAGYAVNDRLSVRGDVLWLGGEIDQTLYGAEAQYGFANGTYAQFGVLDGTNGQATTLDATFGLSF